jgi:hypothetical protein
MPRHFLFHAVFAVSFLATVGCGRVRPTDPAGQTELLAENRRARQLLCSDIGEEACLAVCPRHQPTPDHAECLLRFRLASDPEALDIARTLYAHTKTLVGVHARAAIAGYRGEESVELFPALPVGADRHHLDWLHASLQEFDDFVASLSSRAARPVLFDPRPRAFVFFRTAEPSYPSAFCLEEVIAYNLRGLLHRDRHEMHETLFHELFHVNDARRGFWSIDTLGSLFDSIVARCRGDHDCLAPFAPHESIVPDGTYYAFDERTGDAREYAAELALRYFIEQQAILHGELIRTPPFKCLTADNHIAWDLIVNEFFGGLDLSPDCDAPELVEVMRNWRGTTRNGS